MSKKNPVGRPTKFTQEIADKICERLSTSSDGVRVICNELNINTSSLLKWLAENEDFSTQYARAREMQADHMSDEIQEICNEAIKLSKRGVSHQKVNAFVQAMRLKVDALKWTASKLKPKKYGDKLDVTTGGDKLVKKADLSKLSPEELTALEALTAKLGG